MNLLSAVSAFAFRGARRRTALQLLLAGAGIAVALIALAAWITVPAPEPTLSYDGSHLTCYGRWYACQVPTEHALFGLADALALGLASLLGLIVAPAMVVAQVAQERRSGTLDQLRTTPLGPASLAVGIAVGSSLRALLLAVGPLALHVALGALGVIRFDAMLGSTVALVLGTVASLAVALAVALAPGNDAAGGSLLALVTAVALGFLAFLSAGMASGHELAAWAFLHPFGGVFAAMLQSDDTWRRLFSSEWDSDRFSSASYLAQLTIAPVASAIGSLLVAVLLGRAARRRLARPELPLLSKPLALTLFAALTTSLMLPSLTHESGGHHLHWDRALAPLLLFLPVAAVLAALATPTPEAWSLGVRLAHARARRIAPFADTASPHLATWLMGAFALALVAAFALPCGVPHPRDARALLLVVGLYAALPVHVHFLFTRLRTVAARVFGAALLVALGIAQTIAIGMVEEGPRDPYVGFVVMITIATVVVTVALARSQRALAKQVREVAAA